MHHGIVKLIVSTIEAHPFAGPEKTDDLDRLLQHPEPPLHRRKRESERIMLPPVPADTEPEREAPA